MLQLPFSPCGCEQLNHGLMAESLSLLSLDSAEFPPIFPAPRLSKRTGHHRQLEGRVAPQGQQLLKNEGHGATVQHGSSYDSSDIPFVLTSQISCLTLCLMAIL